MAGINAYLGDLDDNVRWNLKTDVEIIDSNTFPDLDDLLLEKRRWLRISNVVAVAVDLKNSTRLDFKHQARTSTRLYEAIIGNCVTIMKNFQADFVDIQGDGLFALYHGDRAQERAMAAGITLKTFSQRSIVPRIGGDMDERFPKTGLKTGISAGILVVKKVGKRNNNEPVWAGKPVNWATKCAQKAHANELIVTESVYANFENNDYVRYSCGYANGQYVKQFSDLWKQVIVDTLPDSTVRCMSLTSGWCETHGDEFCQALLAGKRNRSDMQWGNL